MLETKWDCIDQGGLWLNRTFNFDNMINGLVMLFVMSTTAGWSEMMFQTIKSTDIDLVPGEERSIYWVLFFVVFMIVGCFFFLNLFIGVVINTFH